MLFEGVVQRERCEWSCVSSQHAQRSADASSNIDTMADVSVKLPTSMTELTALAMTLLSMMVNAMHR
jgi:hypothetical protein